MSRTDGVRAEPGAVAPLPREVVEPIVSPHLTRFGEALCAAWADFTASRDAPASQLARVRAASQGMVVSDLLADPVTRIFAGVAGAQVLTRFDRPWVHLAGGRVQVRFRILTPTLGVCPGQSDRAVRLAYHLPDETLAVQVPADGTVLTAGLVLDAARQRIERLALVCLVGFNTVHFWFPLPGVEDAVAPTQMALTPLSEPIIRSARDAAAKRLAAGAGDDR